jgi:hypothetical protein
VSEKELEEDWFQLVLEMVLEAIYLAKELEAGLLAKELETA